MRSVAYTAEPVQGWNAQSGGEVAVGSPAHRGFAQLPSQLAGYVSGLCVERGYSGGALHGRAVNTSADFDLAFAIEGTKTAHFLVNSGSIFHAGYTHVDLCGGFGWNHVGARSSADDSDIDRQALFQIGEVGYFLDLPGQFTNCIHTFSKIEPGVGGLAGNPDGVIADSFPSRLQGALPSVGRLENEHGRGSFCQR